MIGSGVVEPGQASIIAGTWSINQVVASRAIVDRGVFMVSAFDEGRLVAIESSATSAANLEWYVRELVARGGDHDDPFGACNRLVADLVPARDDPFFHPYPPRLAPRRRDARRLHGIAGWHGEGICPCALRGCRLRASPPHRRAARRRGFASTARHCPGAARAAPSGPRCSPTSSASRSRSRIAARPGRWAPPSPPGSGRASSPIFRPASAADDAPRGACRARPGHGLPLCGALPYYAMLTEAMRPVWRRMAGVEEA
jgi:L-xylulokinase